MTYTVEASTLCANPDCTQPKHHAGECDDAPSYAQTVTRLAREYHQLVNDGAAPPVAYFSLTGRLNDAAVNAGIDRVTSVRDLKDEIDAESVKA